MKYDVPPVNNIVDVFNRFFELNNEIPPEKIFLEIEGEKYSYEDFTGNVKKLCALFYQANLKEGERIVLSANNDYDTALFFLALLRFGLTAVLIDVNVNPHTAMAIIKQSEVSGYIIENHLYNNWGINAPGSFSLVIKRENSKKNPLFQKLLSKKNTNSTTSANIYPDLLRNTLPRQELPAQINENTLAYILFTSGTTNDPKGVMISHKNLFTHLETLSNVYKLNNDSRLLNNLMLYHVDGIVQGPLLAAYNGATLIRPVGKFELTKINDFFKAVYKYRITHFITVPAILSLMYKYADGFEDSFKTRDFAFIISAAAHLEKALWENFEKKFKTMIVNVYGLTETVTGSLFCGPDISTRKTGTIGKPVDCEAKIIREDGSEAGINEPGELLLKGNHVTPGYINNPEATKEVLRNNWLYTGDIAILDEEGFFTITGRKKNIIIVGGLNIQPEEVTEIINRHPDVMESVSLGTTDEVFGERLISCIVKKADSNLDEFKISDYLINRIEPGKMPSEILFLEELPKGLSGKVMLNELRTVINQKKSLPVDQKTYMQSIFSLASEAFKVPLNCLEAGSGSKNLKSWDSVSHLLFVTNLEKKFNVRFNNAEIMKMDNLKAAGEVLRLKMHK